jgi:hypothetical protein
METGYKPAEVEKLREVYSPEQMAAIEAGEKAISGAQLGETSERADPWSPDYFDDLSQVDPFLDKPVRAPWSTADETPRMKTEDEIDDELAQLTLDMPAEGSSDDQVWENYIKNMRVTVGGDSEGQGRSAAAPEAPNKIKKKNPKQKEVQGEASPALVRLMQMTGYTLREISALRVKSIISHAVVNQKRTIILWLVMEMAGSALERESQRKEARRCSRVNIERYETCSLYSVMRSEPSLARSTARSAQPSWSFTRDLQVCQNVCTT